MNIGNYDILIVGSGFAGGIIAYLSAKAGKRVLLLEKRNHIAGNMYDEIDEETGLLLQKYGPHSFHTDNKQVYDLITEIGEWEPFTLQARVEIKGKMTPSPFNFTTIDMYFPKEKGAKIKKHLVDAYDYAPKVTILEMLEHDDPVIREYAEFLFEEDYRPYTVKQWGISPKDLDISVLRRVPVRLSYIDQYFDDKYQMLPVGGFSEFFKKMLDNPNITVSLSVDALDRIKPEYESGTMLFDGQTLNIPVVYTGALDELMEHKFGKLPYRSLHFEYVRSFPAHFQEATGIAYPFAKGYTRVIDYSNMPVQDINNRSVLVYEYPVEYGSELGEIPYYPTLTKDSQNMYSCYLEHMQRIPNLYPCGRLADFKYYNMDNAIERAMDVFNTIKF